MDACDQTDGYGLKDTARSLPIALLRLRERLMERFRPILQAHGLTEQQWRVLRVLQEAEVSDLGQLAGAACILPPSLSRMIRGLDARGLIAIAKDPGDGRRALLRLSPEGLRLIRTIAPQSAAIYAGIEARLGRDRIEALLDDIADMLGRLGPGG